MEHHTEQLRTDLEQLVKARPLAEKLNCSVAMVYAMARQGKIPSVRIGKTGVRFNPADVLAALTQGGSK